MSGWFDTEHGHEAQPPAWLHPPQRRSIAPLVLTVAFVGIAGYITWQLATSGTFTPTSTASFSGVTRGDDLVYQQTAEAAQAETNQLLVMLIDTTLLVNPSPTPSPTKHPTNVPSTKVALPSCNPSSGLPDGELCSAYPTPTPKITPPVTPTPESCEVVFATPMSAFSKKPCYFVHTPTPEGA